MEKIKTFVKETNGLAIFSFLIAVFASVYEFIISHECGTTVANLTGLGAVFMGIISLIWMRRKKQKGKWFAILGIIMGILATGLVSLC
jgi:multidrug transporter EmrE-like cation transporter